MKLRNQAITIIGLAWLAFIALTSIPSIRDTTLFYFTLSAVFFLTLLALIYIFIIKRYEDEILHHKNLHKMEEKKVSSSEENQKRYLSQIARYDSLTSLPNKVVFNEILNKALSFAKRRKKKLAILMVNVDALKIIYDKFGDKRSNQLLQELGKRFSDNLRAEDVLAKLEGNEFIVLLNDIVKPKFASAVAEKLLKASAQPIDIGTREFSIKSSIGICVYPEDGNSLEELLKNAEIALYKAKHSGPGEYQFHMHEMDIEGHEYIQLEHSLRNAIQNKEFTLYYQPKISIKKGNITSLEALIRWEHPKLGLINPDKFIPLAEETGMINELGNWALTEVCKMNKHWQDEGYEHISVSINLSPKQFHHPDIANTISKILNETGLSPNYLELEITEKTAMDDTETAINILNALKAVGVQISLDHFGTGYTSISHLKQFPINALKIDQGFIKGIPHTPNDSAITSAIIALAHNLGFEVVATGVETAEQVQYLANQHCDMVQGYFLSHPQPAENVVLQLRKLRDEVLL